MTDFNWTGASGLSDLASDPDNWDQFLAVPSTNDVAIFDLNGGDCTWDISSVGTIQIGPGYGDTINQSVNVVGNFEGEGSGGAKFNQGLNDFTFVDIFQNTFDCFVSSGNLYNVSSVDSVYDNTSIVDSLTVKKTGDAVFTALTSFNVSGQLKLDCTDSSFTFRFASGSLPTLGSFLTTGIDGNLVTVIAATSGVQADPTVVSALPVNSYASFKDISMNGGPINADGTCIDNGNNDGIIFAESPLVNSFIRVDLNDFEIKMFERAFDSTDLTDLVPADKIKSHLPQDTELPYIRGYDSGDAPWGTKSTTGFESTWDWHIWSDYSGNKEVNQISMVLIKLFDNAELDLDEGKNVLLQFSNRATFIEQDGVTHHAVVSFRALSS